MHPYLYTAVEESIAEARQFMLRTMPIGLTNDQIYESLLGDAQVAQAFANAARYLPTGGLSRRVTTMTEDYGTLSLNIRLTPTEKYPVFLIPKDIPVFSRKSDLSRALALPFRVARDWHMLGFAFTRLANDVDDVNALAFIFPWIREIISRWNEEHPGPVLDRRQRPSRVRGLIDKDVKAILSEKTPHRFPRLGEQLNNVCRSGKTLFSQYRMLEASHSGSPPSPVVLESPTASVPDWLVTHLNEVLDEWKEELARIHK